MTSPKNVLELAKVLAGDDPSLNVLIETMGKSIGLRGATAGALGRFQKIAPKSVWKITQEFKGQEAASAYAQLENGYSGLKIEVKDSTGKVVAADPVPLDVAKAVWFPDVVGVYTIEVTNMGDKEEGVMLIHN